MVAKESHSLFGGLQLSTQAKRCEMRPCPASKKTGGKTGWPHSSQDKIPCVFPEFSLCYEFFPCVFFHKLIDGFE